MNISFYATQTQIRLRTKIVTRRQGWRGGRAAPQKLLTGVEKGQGLKAGERVTKIDVIRVTDVSFPVLETITAADVLAEGFYHGQGPEDFIKTYTGINPSCDRKQTTTRIGFTYEYPAEYKRNGEVRRWVKTGFESDMVFGVFFERNGQRGFEPADIWHKWAIEAERTVIDDEMSLFPVV